MRIRITTSRVVCHGILRGQRPSGILRHVGYGGLTWIQHCLFYMTSQNMLLLENRSYYWSLASGGLLYEGKWYFNMGLLNMGLIILSNISKRTITTVCKLVQRM